MVRDARELRVSAREHLFDELRIALFARRGHLCDPRVELRFGDEALKARSDLARRVALLEHNSPRVEAAKDCLRTLHTATMAAQRILRSHPTPLTLHR